MPTTSTRTTVRRSGGRRPRRASGPLADDRQRRGGAGRGAGDGTPPDSDRRRTGSPPAQLPDAAARRAARAGRDAPGDEADVRRGVEGALRRGRADATMPRVRERAGGAVEEAAGLGTAARALRAFRSRFVDPARSARCDVQGGDRRLPQPDAASTSRCRPARASPSSTSPARAGAATTGTRATTGA